MAENELAAKLNRRQILNEEVEGEEATEVKKVMNHASPYAEFKEFSIKQIKDFEKTFKKYDVDGNKFIDITELKLMMEKLEVPQTHIALKNMIKEVDEDNDDMISFREFLLIFRKANAGELEESSGLFDLYNHMTEIDVDAEGVKGAKNFFQAKIEQQSKSSKFEMEIKQEQEEKRKQAEEAKERKEAFRKKATMFQGDA